MRLITLLFASLTLLISASATAAVDIEPGEYVVFYHHDVLGSPVTATNEQGQVIWHERTESYGKSEGRVSQNGNPFGDNALPAGNSRQGYTGHTLDSSAGLTYMKARYYDHNIGRFLSNDPVNFVGHLFDTQGVQGYNRYAYANGNPYKFIDPDGKTIHWVGAPADVELAKTHLTKVATSGRAGFNAVADLAKSKNRHTIMVAPNLERNSTEPTTSSGYLLDDGKPNSGTNTRIWYNPFMTNGPVDDSGNTKTSPEIGLAHEIGHAADLDKGIHPQFTESETDAITQEPNSTPNYEKGRSMRLDNHMRHQVEGVDYRSEYYR